MSTEKHRTDRITGWALAAVLFMHLLLLRSPASVMMAAFLLLLVGAILRGKNISAPRWLAWVLLIAGVTVVLLADGRAWDPTLPAEVAAMLGCSLLLRTLTPMRGLWALLCLLVMLLGILVQPIAAVNGVFVVVDVIILMLLAEQVHRPPEAALSFWVSILRSLRVVVPVAIIVTLIFSFFPDLSPQTPRGIIGFDGSGMLNPGSFADMSQSRRVALVARFPREQSLPRPGDLYWRGQVLERNEGLKWLLDEAREKAPKGIQEVTPHGGQTVWRYLQEIRDNKEGGILAVLDQTVFVDAKREGLEVLVLDQGASVLSAVGSGDLSLEVTAVGERVDDAPDPGIASASKAVPRAVRTNEAVRNIVQRTFEGTKTTSEKLEAIGKYLRESNFVYTTRPGRIAPDDVAGFLVRGRRGFCGHYAAATANILRMGGVPARVVTGYRGGVWNPWVRTITVRDSEAHAWVEAWDEPSQRWLRFDPTDYVSPDFSSRIARDMNSESWPWYRSIASLGGAVLYTMNTSAGEAFTWLMALEAWEYLQPVAVAGLVIFGGIWLWRERRRRQGRSAAEQAAQWLTELERRAARAGCPRKVGETPLAWLRRLEREAGDDGEAENLRRFAESYENEMYGARSTEVAVVELTTSAKSLRQIWKSRGHTKLAVS